MIIYVADSSAIGVTSAIAALADSMKLAVRVRTKEQATQFATIRHEKNQHFQRYISHTLDGCTVCVIATEHESEELRDIAIRSIKAQVPLVLHKDLFTDLPAMRVDPFGTEEQQDTIWYLKIRLVVRQNEKYKHAAMSAMNKIL